MSEDIIHLERSMMYTPVVLGQFRKHYAELEIRTQKDGSLDLVVTKLAPTQRLDLDTDLQFFQRNPDLPTENICSRMENYMPKNPSQNEVVFYANALLDITDPTVSAGLYIHGDSGIGKSHLSVAIAKKLMLKGAETYFTHADKLDLMGEEVNIACSRRIELGPNQVWIIDDLNSGFGLGPKAFKAIVLNAHQKGGRVFVTSNTPYDKLVHQMFGIKEEEELARYEDRIQAMFKILHVIGGSARQAVAWHQSIEMTERSALEGKLQNAIARQDFEEAAKLRDQIKALSK